MPLNYDSASNFFLLENDKMEFDNGKMYFIDTCKMHTLFNTSNTPFYFVVVNVILSEVPKSFPASVLKSYKKYSIL